MTIRSNLFRRFSSKPNDFKIFDKILIANRGEIACRVIKTAKKLGVKTVGVYSEADVGSTHTLMADESYCIGPPPSAESYLKMDKIIEVAKATGAQAVHPGYGFLSENHIFANKLQASGIKFIGPGSEAMKSMASKSEAKSIMIKAGVPVTPGYHGEDQSLDCLKQEAKRIGYPIMIKAVMGGGGKGMRIAESVAEFEEKLESSKRESRKHFADDRVILEKYIRRSRHIEVQVFADSHGDAVYLFERDCSVQRRHQKILEEAPAPELTEAQRKDLGEKAVAAAKAVSYEGAGTVEFIWDCDSNEFYFMEMNTRLQVEHPVTEMITSVDLVQWQLEIASGRKLPMTQDQINRHGAAVEARIYAENTDNNFMPDVGQLKLLQTPTPSESLRVEMGLRQGDQISVHYDPMIAKVIAYGANRQEALKKLSAALAQFRVAGVRTNVDFVQRILQMKEYTEHAVDTGFIQTHKDRLFAKANASDHELAMGALFLLAENNHDESMLFGPFSMREQSFDIDGRKVDIVPSTDGKMIVNIDGNKIDAKVSKIAGKENVYNMFIDGVTYPEVTMTRTDGDQIALFHGINAKKLQLKRAHAGKNQQESAADLVAPMPCKVVSIPVKIGDRITKGSTVAVLEAMKMEYVLKANTDGIVKSVFFKEGAMVGEKQRLIELEAASA